jgi:small GTP-binding protein
MKNKKNNNIQDCKVVLLGDSGVGKSSIIARYLSGFFREDIVSTFSATYSQKIYEKKGKRIRLNIWDTAGQEEFRSLGRLFYKDAYIICLVFDVTHKQSFNNLKEIWYPDVKEYGEKYKIIALVGNKGDLYEVEEVNEEEINSFKDEINGKYFFVSAKNGQGIDKLFKSMAESFLNPEFLVKIDDNESLKSIQLDNHIIKKKKKNCC